MIDLTPLDVRKKRGDFRKGFRGYDAQEVDTFLEVVAERLEDLVKENLRLRERTESLQEQVSALEGRERAVHEALVTAQELREEVRQQARREADLLRREAEAEVNAALNEGERRLRSRKETLEELERMRLKFIKGFRMLLERNLDALDVEESRSPLDEAPLEIEFSVSEARDAARHRVRDEEGAAGGAGASAPTDVGGSEPGGDAEGTPQNPEAPEARESGAPVAGEPPVGERDIVDVESLAPDGISGEGGPVGEGDEDEDGALWLPSLGEDEEGR